MAQSEIAFDDFISSKRRQKRITNTAIGIGLLLALYIAWSILSMDNKASEENAGICRINSLEGRLMIKRGAKTIEYEPGIKVFAGDTFQTLDNSSMEIEYLDDGTKILLESNVILLINDNTGGKKTNLSSGTAQFIISKQPEGLPMTLTSYNSDAIVKRPGVYIQTYNGLETRFEVISGALEVRRFSDGKITVVTTGESFICRPDDSGMIQFDPNMDE